MQPALSRQRGYGSDNFEASKTVRRWLCMYSANEHRAALLASLRRFDGLDIEAIAQEAMLRLHTNVGEVKHELSWLRVTAYRRAVGETRRPFTKYRGPMPVAERGETVERDALSDELVRKVLDMLPQTQRNVVIRKDGWGMSHSEIADDLGITVGASKTALCRGRAAFRRIYTRLT